MRDSKRDTSVYSSLLDSVGEGEDGMIWENGVETSIRAYKKLIDGVALKYCVHFCCTAKWIGYMSTYIHSF